MDKIKRLKKLIYEADEQNLINLLRKWLSPRKLTESEKYYKRGLTNSSSYFAYKHLKDIIERFFPRLDIERVVNFLWEDFYLNMREKYNIDLKKYPLAEFYTKLVFDILTEGEKDEKWKEQVREEWRKFLNSEDFEEKVFQKDLLSGLRRNLKGYYRPDLD